MSNSNQSSGEPLNKRDLKSSWRKGSPEEPCPSSTSGEPTQSRDLKSSWRKQSTEKPSTSSTEADSCRFNPSTDRRSSSSTDDGSSRSRSPHRPLTLEEGRVYYLQDKARCQDLVDYPAQLNIHHPGIFGHPVVVLRVDGDHAIILITTSLKRRALRDFVNHTSNDSRDRVHSEHVPIYPNTPHYRTGELLYLENGRSFPEDSYLKIMDEHVVPKECLKPWYNKNNQELKFTSDSWDDLQCMREKRPAERQSAMGHRRSLTWPLTPATYPINSPWESPRRLSAPLQTIFPFNGRVPPSVTTSPTPVSMGSACRTRKLERQRWDRRPSSSSSKESSGSIADQNWRDRARPAGL